MEFINLCVPRHVRAAHWMVWSGAVLFSLAHLCTKRDQIIGALNRKPRETNPDVLWRAYDFADYEWYEVSSVMRSCWMWYASHIVIGQLLAQFLPQLLEVFFILHSSCFLWVVLAPELLVMCAISVLAVYAAYVLRSKLAIYVATFVPLMQTVAPVPFLPAFKISSPFTFNGVVSSSVPHYLWGWHLLRGLSFAMDRLVDSKSAPWSLRDLIKTLAYMLYFPCLFVGPIINYDDFLPQRARLPWSPARLREAAVRAIRLCAAYGLKEVFLHLALVHVVRFGVVKDWLFAQPLWTIAGFGYGLCMGFYLKYHFLYGLSDYLLWLDQAYPVSLRPYCIARYCTVSDTWRYFDIGLHKWLVKYIYKVVVADRWTYRRRVLGCVATYAFVLLWHTPATKVIIWTAINFVFVLIEMSISPEHHKWLAENFSPLNARMVKAMGCAISYLAAVVSCLYFLSDVHTANTIVNIMLLGFPIPLLPLLGGLYCCSHVAFDIFDWEHHNKRNGDKKAKD